MTSYLNWCKWTALCPPTLTVMVYFVVPVFSGHLKPLLGCGRLRFCGTLCSPLHGRCFPRSPVFRHFCALFWVGMMIDGLIGIFTGRFRAFYFSGKFPVGPYVSSPLPECPYGRSPFGEKCGCSYFCNISRCPSSRYPCCGSWCSLPSRRCLRPGVPSGASSAVPFPPHHCVVCT